MKIKLPIIAFMILIVSLSISEGRPFCNKRDPLFKVERSKNANFVRYDACLLQDGNLSGSNPVDVYWVLGRGEKEELNAIEKEYAYGIDSRKKLGENKFRIVINALKDREIIVEELNADYKAFVRIKGKRSILEKVYVKSEERSLGFPKVNYVDLFGRSLQTNQPVRERIVPS